MGRAHYTKGGSLWSKLCIIITTLVVKYNTATLAWTFSKQNSRTSIDGAKFALKSDINYSLCTPVPIHSPAHDEAFHYEFFIPQPLSLPVVAQSYKVDVEILAASRGCTAILRCVVPSFVKELVRVVSWVQEPAFFIYPSLQGGESANKLSLRAFSRL